MPTPTWYEIWIDGQLDPRWSTWFDGWTITHTADGTTTLRGPAPDQAALYGQIARLRDLGLTLLAVARCRPPPGGDAGASAMHEKG